MIAFSTALIVLSFIEYATNLSNRHIYILVLNILLAVLVIPAIGFVYGLLGFHIFLSQKNVTTNEFCKKTWNSFAGNFS